MLVAAVAYATEVEKPAEAKPAEPEAAPTEAKKDKRGLFGLGDYGFGHGYGHYEYAPAPVVHHAPVHHTVVKTVGVPVHVPKPYPVHVPVDRPYPVKVRTKSH